MLQKRSDRLFYAAYADACLLVRLLWRAAYADVLDRSVAVVRMTQAQAQPAALAELAASAKMTVAEITLLMMKLELNVFDQGQFRHNASRVRANRCIEH